MSDLFSLQSVPIFSAGTWNNDVYHEADLDAIVAAHGQVGFKPPLKLGHDETQPLAKSDSMPALGWVTNLRRVGKTLYADFTDLPKRVWEAITRKAYDRVSAEIYWDYVESGRKFPRVLKAVALLGAEIPAVTSLQALQSLYAAQGQTVKTYMEGMMPIPTPSGGMAIATLRKAKADVNYREAGEGGYERCGACRFFTGPPDPEGEHAMVANCSLVEGEIASSFVCDLVEVRDAFQTYKFDESKHPRKGKGDPEGGQFVPAGGDGGEGKDGMIAEMSRSGAVKAYVIRKRDGKWCLMTQDGSETLGCHDTEEGAMAQERAVQAAKRGAQEETAVKEYRYSVDEVAEFCPECAEKMRFLNLKELKITYDPATKTYAGFNEGLCKRFGPSEGFRTRCMESSLGANADDPGAMCNALKEFCFGTTKETAEEQSAKTYSENGARSKEGESMTEQEKQELEALRAKVATLEAAGAAQAVALETANAQLKTYEQQIAASESEKAAAAEIARQTGNKAWLDAMCQPSALRMVPAEREYAAYLLDVLTEPAGMKLKTYSRTVKDGAKEELPAVAVFKRFFEMRQPNQLIFRELTAGSVTADAGRAPVPESLAEARAVATGRAKEYIAKQKEAGQKVDFKTAYAHVLAEDPELRQACSGVRPEGVRKAAEGITSYRQMVGKVSDASA